MTFRRAAPFALILTGVSALAWAAPRAAVEKYQVNLPQSSMPAGAAKTIVAASPDIVRSLVLDYGKYAGFIKSFESSRVVGRNGDKTDVYLQVPILKGAAKIWAVVRFEPPRADGDSELVVARMIKGNVKRLDANWRIRKIGEDSTELKLELLIVPSFPAPVSIVIPEVRDAAATAVSGVRGAAERRRAPQQ